MLEFLGTEHKILCLLQQRKVPEKDTEMTKSQIGYRHMTNIIINIIKPINVK